MDSEDDVVCLDSEDDVVCLENQGKRPLFPNDPVFGLEFQKYLKSLAEQDPKVVLELAKIPPLPVKTANSAQGRPPKTTYCFITGMDLLEIRKEETRIAKFWPKAELDKLSYVGGLAKLGETQPSIQFLAIHHFLLSHILKTKRTLVEQYMKDLSKTDTSPEMKAKNELICCSLYFQSLSCMELYRATRGTNFMQTKLRLALPNTSTKTSRTPTKRSKLEEPAPNGKLGMLDLYTAEDQIIEFNLI